MRVIWLAQDIFARYMMKDGDTDPKVFAEIALKEATAFWEVVNTKHGVRWKMINTKLRVRQ